MAFSFSAVHLVPEIIYDGIVIGGGLAGSALATLLAREGKNILLLEKENVPHHKVCGEFLSRKAVDYLKILGVDPEKSGAHYIHSIHLIDGKNSITQTLPCPGWSLSRLVLDEAMLQRAEEAGAVIKRGSTVRNFLKQDNLWDVQVSEEPAQRSHNIFLATGKHDLRHWKRNWPTTDLIGFKMYFRLSTAQLNALSGHTEINLINGGYAGLQLVENQQANLCFLVNKNVFQQCEKNWDHLLIWLKEQSPHLSKRLEGAQELWSRPKAIYQIPYGYIESDKANPGLFRLGDQKAVIHSFAGDGMAMALNSAFTAANIYLKQGDAAQYNREMQDALCRPVRRAQILAKLALNPFLSKAILPAVQKFPALVGKFYHSTRC